MSAIADQWTGNGLSDGTAITTGNVATAGNFTGSLATWVRAVAGSPTQVTAGDGQAVTAPNTADIGRIEATLGAGSSLRGQLVFTAPAATSGVCEIVTIRTTATIAHMRWDGTARTFTLRDNNNAADLGLSPAVADDDEILIDVVAALHTSPTISNGRLFYRLKNKTNPSWNTTGEHFYDSLYTRNLQTTLPTIMRFGKNGTTGTMTSAVRYEFIGVEGIVVSTSDTSEAQAKAYFADDPDPAVVVTPKLRTNQAVRRLA